MKTRISFKKKLGGRGKSKNKSRHLRGGMMQTSENKTKYFEVTGNTVKEISKKELCERSLGLSRPSAHEEEDGRGNDEFKEQDGPESNNSRIQWLCWQ